VARTNKNRAPALAYLQTSSAANVGTDKDSEKRQRQSVESFAKRGGFEIIAEFYDAAVSGADSNFTSGSYICHSSMIFLSDRSIRRSHQNTRQSTA
jgi:hypothetical protein